jgi:outer membrane receptor protein involved in Fe transport
MRVALSYYDTEGYFPFTFNDTKGPSQENLAARLITEWAPTDAFDLSLTIESQKTDMFGVPGSEQINCDFSGNAFCALVAADPRYDSPISYTASGLGTGFGPFGGLAGVTLGMLGIVPPGHPAFDAPLCPTCGNIIDVSAYRTMNDMGRDTDSDTVALTMNWYLGIGTLTSQTAFQSFFNEIGWELDGTAVAGFGSHQEDEQDQFSQELRLTSVGGQVVDWMVGLYYQDADFNTWTDWVTAYDGGQFIAITSPLAPYRFVETDIDDRFVSVFASLTWHVTDRFSIDLGARYTDVDKEAVNIGLSRFINPDGNPATADFGAVIPASEQSIAKTFDDSSTDPELALNWQLSDNSRAYLRFAQGFKSGGFGVGITIPDDDPATSGYMTRRRPKCSRLA